MREDTTMTTVLIHCRGFLVCKGPSDSTLELRHDQDGTIMYPRNEGPSANAEQPEQAALTN